MIIAETKCKQTRGSQKTQQMLSATSSFPTQMNDTRNEKIFARKCFVDKNVLQWCYCRYLKTAV